MCILAARAREDLYQFLDEMVFECCDVQVISPVSFLIVNIYRSRRTDRRKFKRIFYEV